MYKIIPILFTLLLSLSSCVLQNNYGFPKKIHVPAEGGTTTISADNTLIGVAIYDYDGKGESSSFDDLFFVSYDWLSIEAERGGSSITILAQPNTTRKKRKLYVTGYWGPDYAEIKVIQDKH